MRIMRNLMLAGLGYAAYKRWKTNRQEKMAERRMAKTTTTGGL